MSKIAIVAHGLNNGGAERVASLLANRIYEKGNMVIYIAVYSKDKDYYLNDNIAYYFVDEKRKNKFFKLIGRSKKINQILNENKCDYVISFITNEMIVPSLFNRIPVIFSMRNDPRHLLKRKYDKVLCKLLYNRAYKIVFQTPGAQSFFSNQIQKKSVVIGNPIPDNLPVWKANESKTIITACRLTYQKNIPMLIKAFKLFSENHSEYTLKIYGEGELKKEYIKLCEKENIEKKVLFMGRSNEIYNVMASSSIFALSSNFEGLSNSMLEALAIGIPTVCTDCPPGGARLYIDNFKNGVLVPVDDENAMAKAFDLIANDKKFQMLISKNAMKIREKLEENKIIDLWLDLIR